MTQYDAKSWFVQRFFSIVSLLLVHLLALVAVFLVVALSFSLSLISATLIADILGTLLMSAFLLRIVELLLSVIVGSRQNAGYSMEVFSLLLLIPSILLEIISIGFRSFSLGFRIFANVSAGHVLSDIILVIRYLPFQSLSTVFLQSLFSFGIVLYEFLVATIQLGVLVSLTSVYAD
jgi:F0F1-type ATP synthase membrane subunit a